MRTPPPPSDERIAYNWDPYEFSLDVENLEIPEKDSCPAAVICN